MPNEAITFNHCNESIFHFLAQDDNKIILDASEVSDDYQDLQVDIYVTVNDENVGPDNYHWKSDYGICEFEIDPNTDNFQPGLFRVAFVTKQDQQALNQSIALSIQLKLEPCPRMIKLNQFGDEPLASQVDD